MLAGEKSNMERIIIVPNNKTRPCAGGESISDSHPEVVVMNQRTIFLKTFKKLTQEAKAQH